MSELTTEQRILIEQRVTNDAKSTGVAYLLWLFLGGVGGHRFYLGQTGTGIAMLVLTVLGLVTLAAGVGAFFLLGVGIWTLVDAFLIPGMIRQDKERIRNNLTLDLIRAKSA